MMIDGILVMADFILILVALYFNIKVLRDKTKKDYVLPWKFTFVALIFFFIFEFITVFEKMGLIAWWDMTQNVDIFRGLARIGIVGSFLFGLMVEDKHEHVEEKQIVGKMLSTKRKRKEIKK